MQSVIKKAEVNELEKQIVWDTVKGFIITTRAEFSNPTDLVSMHHFFMDALDTIETYRATNNDVDAMKKYAAQLFHNASANVTIDYGV